MSILLYMQTTWCLSDSPKWPWPWANGHGWPWGRPGGGPWVPLLGHRISGCDWRHTQHTCLKEQLAENLQLPQFHDMQIRFDAPRLCLPFVLVSELCKKLKAYWSAQLSTPWQIKQKCPATTWGRLCCHWRTRGAVHSICGIRLLQPVNETLCRKSTNPFHLDVVLLSQLVEHIPNTLLSIYPYNVMPDRPRSSISRMTMTKLFASVVY